MGLKRFIFHGSLKKLLPDGATIECRTIAEGIEGLSRQIPSLRSALGKPRQIVNVIGYSERLHALFEPSDDTEVHIAPAFFGGKNGGGFFKIVLGAVLIAASFMVPGTTMLFGTTSLSSVLFGVGLSMALGGLMELLSPTPKIDKPEFQRDPEASKYLGAPKNTTKIGTRIPLLYGTHQVYGHYLSFDIDAVQI